MEKIASGRGRQGVNKAQIKNVMIKHLHSVYFSEVYVLEFLEQTRSKVQNKELQTLIDQLILILKDHIAQLEQLYAKLNLQPDNTYMSGIRSYTQEAMMVFLMESKTQFEKELVMLSYLDVIIAINITQVRMLISMATSLHISDTYFKTLTKGCVEIANSIKKLEGSYLGYPSPNEVPLP